MRFWYDITKHHTEPSNSNAKFKQWVRLPTKPGERLQGLVPSVHLHSDQRRTGQVCLHKEAGEIDWDSSDLTEVANGLS